MPSKPTDSGPLGLLGGTFDPIHLGHLRLAEEAHEALGLAQVVLIPAGEPPHRGTPRSPASDRLAMVRLAAAGNAAFAVDAGEVFAETKSYTILTLERLRALHGPQRPLVLLLGADAFEGLPSWHRWHELLEFAHIAVANRPGFAPRGSALQDSLSPELAAACTGRIVTDSGILRTAPGGKIVPFDMTPLAISASQIRALIHDGHSARYLLPDSVLDYIGLHHLYNRT